MLSRLALSLALAPAALAQPESVALSNSSYVRADSAASIAPPQFTIETWFRADGPGYGFANDGFGAALVNKPGEGLVGNSLTSWGLYWSSSTQRIIAHITHQLYTQGTYLQSNAVIPLGTLAHAAMTFDGTTLRLYINGQLDNSTTTPTSVVYYSPTMPVLIGASNFGAGYTRRFQGLIDEVRIWDHARTAGEIAASCQPHGPGLVASWTFDDSSLADSSGNGHNATAPAGITLAFAPQPAALAACYANCDCSTTSPTLNVQDFTCFLNAFTSASPYANCDRSTAAPVLNVQDFTCFLNRFASGCP